MAFCPVDLAMRWPVRIIALCVLLVSLILGTAYTAGATHDPNCFGSQCVHTGVREGSVDVAAKYVSPPDSSGVRRASNTSAELPLFRWRLQLACTAEDAANVSCDSRTQRTCPQAEGRVIQFWLIQRQRLAQGDGIAVDGSIPVTGTAVGTPFAGWIDEGGACIDVTELNPPPSPAEVFSYFERLPLPTLATQHQPPGDGLSGLPVIFYTDSPTTQTFTVDIRGFTVVINAAAERFTWHTGDPAKPEITSTDPGRPYPDETVEHQYRSGTYAAYLTVTWGATFTVDGGASADVPGTTTTDGAPVTFDVVQARAVLTNPYD
jgi:hypothetical protein